MLQLQGCVKCFRQCLDRDLVALHADLANEITIKQTGYRDWITGRLATEEEQVFFGIGHDAAVFVDSRVAFDQNNAPMRLTVTVFPVDRNQLIVNVGPNVPSLTPQADGAASTTD